MFEAERAKARKIWRENALKAELSEAEDREVEGQDQEGRARAVSGVEATEGEGVPGEA